MVDTEFMSRLPNECFQSSIEEMEIIRNYAIECFKRLDSEIFYHLKQSFILSFYAKTLPELKKASDLCDEIQISVIDFALNSISNGNYIWFLKCLSFVREKNKCARSKERLEDKFMKVRKLIKSKKTVLENIYRSVNLKFERSNVNDISLDSYNQWEFGQISPTPWRKYGSYHSWEFDKTYSTSWRKCKTL
uniref:Uncharacterized protein n=1 Tax=Kwoniella pini CBS 10737 TaxID=1296096 RepID=A0A1B9HVW0_9TREE|nr:uncharacterized protein I206_06295 [Kwoniella pini CBS 10737]OCF47398.1 hypothetical protein I206_06295 [Kwoniella pini CBS 10737]